MLACYEIQNINRCANVGSSIAVFFFVGSLAYVSWWVPGTASGVKGLILKIQTEHNVFFSREHHPTVECIALFVPTIRDLLNEALNTSSKIRRAE